MNRRFHFPIVLTFLTSVVFISGCKKVVHQNIQAASNSSVAIIVFNDVFAQLSSTLNNGTPLDQISQSSWNLSGTVCATATLSPLGSVFPKTLTIDYGTGCTDFNGISRKGTFTAEFSGNFGNEGTTIDILFNGFTKGQYTLAGTYSLTVGAADGSGNPTYSETISDAIISWGSQHVLWEADLNRTWTEGDETNWNTPDSASIMGIAGLNDDVFELTGSGSGNDSNTHPFTWESSTALMLQTGCAYINKGTMVISPANFNDGTIDYGMGECDKQATIEVDGEVFNFTQ